MADQNRIEDGLLEQDSNTRRFHLGNAPQAGIPGGLSDDEKAALDRHRDQIKVPQQRPTFKDADGEPISVPTPGLVITDPATGAVQPIKVDERGKAVPPTKAEARAAGKAAEQQSVRELAREPRA